MTDPKPPAPTKTMLDAGVKALRAGDCDWDSEGDDGDAAAVEDVWNAMVRAQPSPSVERREEIARIILGPHSIFNWKDAKTWRLADWTQYPQVRQAIAKADSILALAQPATGAVEVKP